MSPSVLDRKDWNLNGSEARIYIINCLTKNRENFQKMTKYSKIIYLHFSVIFIAKYELLSIK